MWLNACCRYGRIQELQSSATIPPKIFCPARARRRAEGAPVARARPKNLIAPYQYSQFSLRRACLVNVRLIEICNSYKGGNGMMRTVRLTMAQALVRYLCNQFTDDRRRKGAAVCRASSPFSAMATSPASPKRWRRCRISCRPGAGRTSSRWRLRPSASPRRSAGARSWSRATSIGPGRAQHDDRCGRRPCQPAAGADAGRRHFRQSPARSGHAAGRAFRRSDHHRQRCLQGGDALLGPHLHPEQILSSLPQAVGRACSIPADCGPAFIALPQDVQEMAWDYPEAFFEPTVHAHSAAAAGPGRLAEAVRPAQDRQAAADHFRRRRALFRRREGAGANLP